MYFRLALIAWIEIIYETNSYSTRYKVVARASFISETTIFTNLNAKYDNEKHVYEE